MNLRRKLSMPALLTAVILIVAPTICLAQYESNVQGTVTDSTGAVVPNAAITLHNEGTGVDLKEATNAGGYYRFTAVPPGDYTVIAAAPGFKTTAVSAAVTTDETRGVDISLLPGAASVNVTVNSVASDLNPDETRIQTTLSSDEITKLPLPAQDVQQILALTPGVTGFMEDGPGGTGLFSTGGTWNPSYTANGQGTNSNMYLLDDLPVNDAITQGGAIMMPTPDMLDQVAMQTQTFSVENGSAASLETSFNTKSGTNKFHGDLDYTYAGANLGTAEQIENEVNSSKTGYVTYSEPVSNFHQDDVTGSVGGPIWKDKTFFFFSFQNLDTSAGGPDTPTGQDDFDPAFVQWGHSTFPNSAVAEAYTLAPNSLDGPGPGYFARNVYDVLNPGGSLSSSACPTAQSSYSTTIPTFTNGAVSGPNKGALQGGQAYSIPCSTNMYDTNLVWNSADLHTGLQWEARLDQVLRDGKDRIYVMFTRVHQNSFGPSDRPALVADTPSTNREGTVNWIHGFSPRLLNEIHVGNVRVLNGLSLRDPAIAGSIPYGMDGLDELDGYNFIDMFGENNYFAPNTDLEHTYNLRDTVSYNWRNHTFRGGYQFSREDYVINNQVYARAGFGFNIYNPFQLMANQANFTYYLWTASAATGAYQPQIYGATSIWNGVWVDDTWRVKSNLTITAGLRYDDFGNPTPYSDSSPFAPLYPGSGSTFQQQVWKTTTHVSSDAFTQSQANQWQPRVGFAYTPAKGRNLTIHGGFGLYENALTPAQISENLPTQPPTRLSLTLNSPIPFGDFATTTPPYGENYDGQLPFPVYGTDPSGNSYSNPERTAVYSTTLNGFQPNVKPEKFLLYSLGIEQELPARVIFGITYSGSHGYDLVTGALGDGPNKVGNSDWNLTPSTTGMLTTVRPDPEWNELIYTINSTDTSNFNALILTLRQNYKGLTYQANYNWERSLQWSPTYADSENGNIAFWPGIYQQHTYYGPAESDVTDSFSLGGAYEVPKFLTTSRIFNEAVGGWRISTITIAQTGTPFSVGNTSGPSYAFDNSEALDGSGGTPAFPTYARGLPRKGFSRKEISQTGVFTAADFTDPPAAGTRPVLSQQGANTFRNPGYFNVNAGIAKTFALPSFLGGSSGFTLRGDFINLLNRTNWGAITNDVADTPGFGFSTGAGPKRYLQLGGRFAF